MEMFIVKPNLELLNCQDQTHESLVNQKSQYLKHLSKIQSLCHSHKNAIPEWCHDSSNDTECSLLAMGRRTSIISTDSQKHSSNNHINCLNLKLQSIDLSDDLIKSQSDYPFSILNIPHNMSGEDKHWIELKKLQLETDIALVEYKCNKALVKMNNVVKSKFSKEALSREEEERGLKVVSKECDKFKRLENVLKKLVVLKGELGKLV